MKRRIFLVSGSSGEYSDRSDWPVLALTTEAAAQALVARLAAWCDERGCGENPRNISYEEHNALGSPPEDPDFRTDYTGTRYGYAPIDLEWCGHSDCLANEDMARDCAAAAAP